MVTVKRMSEQEYRDFALNHPRHHHWELWDGVPVEKPLMSVTHGDIASYLGFMLADQLDRTDYRVNINGGKARCSERYYFIPDVIVIPAAFVVPFLNDPNAFGAYAEPLPFVAEVWSHTESPYDFEAKLRGYRERGDLEVWYLHPYERTLTVWRRQADGGDAESVYTSGIVPVVSLPGVGIDFDAFLEE
jgi:Uma2 family endonuclease